MVKVKPNEKICLGLTFFLIIASNKCKILTKAEKKEGLSLRQLFEQEYAKIEKSLFLVAIGYLHNTENAKDALQEAVLSAYQSYPTLKNQDYFKTWLTRIVINKCKDFLRKEKYTEPLTDQLDACTYVTTENMEILDALCRLHREVSIYLTLRFYHDMTYDEVATLLQQPVSTVKYRTKNAMIQLRNYLEGDVS